MNSQYQAYNLEEWLSANMHRNYPVVDDVVFKSSDGLQVPTDFIVDMHITIPAVSDSDATARFYVSKITKSGDSINVEISYYMPSGSSFVCALATGISGSLTSGESVASRTFTLVASTSGLASGYTQLSTLTGSLIVGTSMDVLSSYSIAYANGAILPTCISVSPHVVSGITSSTGDTLTGVVTLVAGDGIELSVEKTLESGVMHETVTITRVPTEAELASPYATAEELYQAILEKLGNPIRYINGVTPDENGNIDLIGDDCTTVTAGSHSVSLSNPCATPCCSDYKTADITAAIEALETAKTRLLEYYAALSDNVNEMQARLASVISNG